MKVTMQNLFDTSAMEQSKWYPCFFAKKQVRYRDNSLKKI